MTSTVARSADALDPSTALLMRTMQPYAGKGCVYLKRSSVSMRSGLAVGSGDFSIAESCYIEDTGHFNAVEFNISYNQLFYYTLAECIRDGLLPQFSGWTLTDYWPRQLPNILIHRMSSSYSRAIDSRSYRGVMTITDIGFRNNSRPLVTVETHVEFTDDNGGRAAGDVSIVIVDPPAAHLP
jgi:hypothetical protein